MLALANSVCLLALSSGTFEREHRRARHSTVRHGRARHRTVPHGAALRRWASQAGLSGQERVCFFCDYILYDLYVRTYPGTWYFRMIPGAYAARRSTAEHRTAGQRTEPHGAALRCAELLRPHRYLLLLPLEELAASWVWLPKKRKHNLSPHLLGAIRCTHVLLKTGAPEPGHLSPTWIALRGRACEVFGGSWHHEEARFQLAKAGVFQVGTLRWSKKRCLKVSVIELWVAREWNNEPDQQRRYL